MSSNRTSRVGKHPSILRSARPVTKQLRRQASEVRHDLRRMGNTVKDAAQHRLDELRETAMERYEEGREKVLDLERTAQRFIVRQPLKSVLIAAGLGLLVGRFWRR